MFARKRAGFVRNPPCFALYRGLSRARSSPNATHTILTENRRAVHDAEKEVISRKQDRGTKGESRKDKGAIGEILAQMV
mgnify:CR=1 FL=1